VAITNAEKQARWRARREAQLKAEREALTAEIAALRERLHNQERLHNRTKAANEDQAYLDRIATAAELAEALADPDRQDALREHRRVRNAFVRFDHALRALEERVGAPRSDAGHKRRRDRKRAKGPRGPRRHRKRTAGGGRGPRPLQRRPATTTTALGHRPRAAAEDARGAAGAPG
jgi:hypothetical protein